MNPLEHPYSLFGTALAIYKNGKENLSEVTSQDFIDMLESGLNHFRLQPDNPNTPQVKFEYISISTLKNNPYLIQSSGLANKGCFLAPNIITSEKNAKQVFIALQNLIQLVHNNTSLNKNVDITMSIAPVTGKTNQGKSSQSNPKASLLIAVCCAITNTTYLKPSLTANNNTTCIIPDLSLNEMIAFIQLFEKMLHNNTVDLLTAKKKDNSDKIPRPKIFNGNFPYAPRSHAFGAVGLLGAIGQWSKEAGYIKEAEAVLNSLINIPFYIISYSKTEVVSFDHYVVGLAKEYKLVDIISSLENSNLLIDEQRYVKGKVNPKYALFWMVSSRFLQLFNEHTFKNFLAFRAEYQPDVEKLLNTYFMKKENIQPEIVASARELGRWLNLAAFIAATKQFEEKHKKSPSSKQENLERRKFKSKFLLEIESSAFSAKTPEALLHQVVRRAGQLSFMDAPAEAGEFMDAVSSGEISLDQAKNILLAYSRLKNTKEKTTVEEEADEIIESESLVEEENDLSNI